MAKCANKYTKTVGSAGLLNITVHILLCKKLLVCLGFQMLKGQFWECQWNYFHNPLCEYPFGLVD